MNAILAEEKRNRDCDVMKLQKLLTLLEDARSHATFESAGFYTDIEKDKAVKQITKPFRDSWIIYPLDEALKIVNAEIEKGRNKK